MSTPLEVIQEGEKKLLRCITPLYDADADHVTIACVEEDFCKKIDTQTLALLQVLHDELEGKKKDRSHDPDDVDQDPVAKYQQGYNQAIQDQQDNLQALMNKI